jgi:hypothetical protein
MQAKTHGIKRRSAASWQTFSFAFTIAPKAHVNTARKERKQLTRMRDTSS